MTTAVEALRRELAPDLDLVALASNAVLGLTAEELDSYAEQLRSTLESEMEIFV